MDIISTKDISLNRINAVIFAPSGYGKTKSLSTLPPKTLIISLESGLLSLKDFDIDAVEIKGSNGIEKVNHLREILGELKDSEYDNICFDSLTEIAECFIEVAKVALPERNQTQPMFGHYKEIFKRFLKYVRDMDKNCIFTCLDKDIMDEVGIRKNLPKVVGSLAEELPALFDFVFTIVKVNDEEGKEHRFFMTDGGTVCKDRSGKLNKLEKINFKNIFERVNS